MGTPLYMDMACAVRLVNEYAELHTAGDRVGTFVSAP
jgi:hypothetical protein